MSIHRTSSSYFPVEPTPEAAQHAIVEEFNLFDDWATRYQYLIDLGHKLPELPTTEKTEENRLSECQSMVWITSSVNTSHIDFSAASDSVIVAGLIYLALRVYSGRSVSEILNTKPNYIADIGLAKYLSPTRNNGLAALLTYIQTIAQEKQDG